MIILPEGAFDSEARVVLDRPLFLIARESMMRCLDERHAYGQCVVALEHAEKAECEAVGDGPATLTDAWPWLAGGAVALVVAGLVGGLVLGVELSRPR